MKPITNFYQIKARSWQISTFQRPQKQMIVLNRVSKEPNPLCAADSSSSLMASLCFSLSLSLSICPFMIPSARTQLRKYLQLRAPHQPTSANITARVRYPDKCLMPSVLHSQHPLFEDCVLLERNISYDTNRAIINETWLFSVCATAMPWLPDMMQCIQKYLRKPLSKISVENYCLVMCYCFLSLKIWYFAWKSTKQGLIEMRFLTFR